MFILNMALCNIVQRAAVYQGVKQKIHKNMKFNLYIIHNLQLLKLSST